MLLNLNAYSMACLGVGLRSPSASSFDEIAENVQTVAGTQRCINWSPWQWTWDNYGRTGSVVRDSSRTPGSVATDSSAAAAWHGGSGKLWTWLEISPKRPTHWHATPELGRTYGHLAGRSLSCWSTCGAGWQPAVSRHIGQAGGLSGWQHLL